MTVMEENIFYRRLVYRFFYDEVINQDDTFLVITTHNEEICYGLKNFFINCSVNALTLLDTNTLDNVITVLYRDIKRLTYFDLKYMSCGFIDLVDALAEYKNAAVI